MVSDTSARPRARRLAVPAKMTSSIFWERTALGAWAPSTQPMASTTLDLPLPLGPTTTVTPGSRSSDGGVGERLEPLQGQGLQEQRVSVRPTSAGTPVGPTLAAGRPWASERAAGGSGGAGRQAGAGGPMTRRWAKPLEGGSAGAPIGWRRRSDLAELAEVGGAAAELGLADRLRQRRQGSSSRS